MQASRNVMFSLRALANSMQRRFDKHAIQDNPAGLTGMHYAVIRFVGERAEEQDVCQRDIEQAFNIRRPTATGILKRMERSGLVRREAVPGDARLKKILLTEKGARLRESAGEAIGGMETLLTRGISQADLAVFYRVLDAMIANVRE